MRSLSGGKGRMYLSYTRDGESGLSWAAMIMMVLALNEGEGHLSLTDICTEISGGNETIAYAIRPSVQTTIYKLDEIGYLFSLKDRTYKLSARGKEIISTVSFFPDKSYRDLSDHASLLGQSKRAKKAKKEQKA